MTVIGLLFLFGVVLLALEIFTPGPLCGISGVICLIVGVVLAFNGHGLGGGLIAALVAVAAVVATCYLEFVWLPKSRLMKHVSVVAGGTGTSQPALGGSDMVGREAVAQTVLAPTGYVQVDGRRYEAFCRSGHVEPGTRLRVVGLDNFRIIVSTT